MGSYVIEISDKTKTSLKIKVELPIIGQDKWSALDKGIWACSSGVANIVDKTNYKKGLANKTAVHKHLTLCNAEKVFWAGATLWDFQGLSDVNGSGSGVIGDGWSLKIDYCQPCSSKIIKWRIVG